MWFERENWAFAYGRDFQRDVSRELCVLWDRRSDPKEGEYKFSGRFELWFGFGHRPLTWRRMFNLTGWHDFWFSPFEPWRDLTWHFGWYFLRSDEKPQKPQSFSDIYSLEVAMVKRLRAKMGLERKAA